MAAAVTLTPAPTSAGDSAPGRTATSTDDSRPRQTVTAPPPFGGSRFRFTSGVRAGEVARVRDAENNAILSYRSFSSPVPVVAAAVAAIVAVTGAVAALFLVAEHHPAPAIVALMLGGFFALLIVMLVPATNVTLYAGASPALTISQRSRTAFPVTVYAVFGADGSRLGLFRKSVFSRLGRNQWQIVDTRGVEIGAAIEESASRALMRKVAGKFDRRFDADVMVVGGGKPIARIVRRAGAGRDLDVLEITSSSLDHRVLVALATLILGSEP